MKDYIKKFAIGMLLTGVVFFILNYQYFSKNIRYTVQKNNPKITEVIEPEKIEPNKLFILDLNISAPIIYTSANTEQEFQEALKEGVVHFPGTANPGEFGNCYIFGHSSDYLWSKGKFKSVFALLPKIEKGNKIVVSNSEGVKFQYTVVETKVIASTDTQYLNQGDRTKKILTVQTSYPVGTALKRFIAIAEMQ